MNEQWPFPSKRHSPTVSGYIAIEADGIAELNELVIEAIEQGYQPLGGIAVGASTSGRDGDSGTDFYFYQAVVRYE